jgi:hypothetical protein
MPSSWRTRAAQLTRPSRCPSAKRNSTDEPLFAVLGRIAHLSSRSLRLGPESASGQVLPPGHLAAMSAVVGEAAENREERTTTALTAGVHLTAAVPGTGVGRQPIATSRLTALGQPGDGGAKALREPAIDGRQQVSGLGCGRLGRTTVRSRIGSSGALVGNHSHGCASAGNMSL